MKIRMLMMVVIASVLFASLVWLTRSQEAAFRDALTANEPVQGGDVSILPPPGLQIREIVQACQLITAEAHGTATARCMDQNWRGAAIATVSAPATILFGVDLATLSADRIEIDYEGKRIRFQLPAPRRLATTVDAKQIDEQITIRGMRSKSGIGRTLRESARAQLFAGADELPVSTSAYQTVIAHTADQVSEWVRRFAGEDFCIQIGFDDIADPSRALALGAGRGR
ncbi:MAG: DUF4230 domain-containing protein [Phycisphaerae bacterium]